MLGFTSSSASVGFERIINLLLGDALVTGGHQRQHTSARRRFVQMPLQILAKTGSGDDDAEVCNLIRQSAEAIKNGDWDTLCGPSSEFQKLAHVFARWHTAAHGSKA